MPTSGAAVTVVVDRLSGVFGAALLALVACYLLWQQPVEAVKVLTVLGFSTLVIIGCIAFFAIIDWRWFDGLIHRIPRLHPVVHTVRHVHPSTRALLGSLAYSVAGQVVAGLAVLAIARSLGIVLQAPLLVCITGIILLVAMIPISLAGWGVREAAFIALLVPLGVPEENALVLGVFFGLANLTASLPGGVSMALGFAHVGNEVSRRLS